MNITKTELVESEVLFLTEINKLSKHIEQMDQAKPAQ